MNDWLSQFHELNEKRAWVQQHRVVDDIDILPMLMQPFRYCEADADYQRLQDQLCQQFGVNRLFAQNDEMAGKA